ncbi:ATP-dependent DNA helicase RecG [Parvularcula dongshanensis]|uniref:Probable DNA 3'-5' helicase RecG n=1 Tax=Parvularcula dongshanensis TaxID=1173995 RepID=A0A840I664_9PROT|nr:ATP-dependent DNA helicase RecG [Parvularcula dongshanensis]
MRPTVLNPLFADITALPKIGPKLAALIGKVAGARVVDLLFTLPVGLIDRSYRPTIAMAEEDRLATIEVTVDRHDPPPQGKLNVPWRVLCSDETGFLTLVFFRAKGDWIREQLPEGERRLVSGRVESYGSQRQMAHPDLILPVNGDAELPPAEPVYPLTAGLTSKVMRRAASAALDRAPKLDEWQRPDVLHARAWPSWHEALTRVHNPEDKGDLNPQSVARQRLAYDELLSNQLALALIRHRRTERPGRRTTGDGHLTNDVRAALPFALTGAQEEALKEVLADMAAPSRMVRLVQGDVGSGKTVVALMAMLTAVEAGAQAAIMAPTEILARQHFETIKPLCDAADVACELITGRDRGQERAAKRAGVAKGYVKVVVGTHALFSDDVAFDDLALVVVDEQHRFGVHQRLALQEKGPRADLLVMTATPIPRTLALTTYGDMEVSTIGEKPPGRKPVDTRAVPLARLDQVTEGIGRAILRGEQAYWVCPLVEANDMLDQTAAEERYEALAARFPGQVGLVHGKMKGPQKDAVVEAFYRGEIKLLVATTVIEVGVNAPDATVIVIEHAERFGLAQLHQLRGRVGRGDKPATCILLYKAGEGGKLGDTAKARLNVLRETEDGFVIAEQDLALRGAGDALGTAQSGFPQFRVADVADHAELLQVARDDAQLVVQTDPELQTERGEALRTLLYLFGQNDAVKLLRSG